jgi:hypothetical protein
MAMRALKLDELNAKTLGHSRDERPMVTDEEFLQFVGSAPHVGRPMTEHEEQIFQRFLQTKRSTRTA